MKKILILLTISIFSIVTFAQVSSEATFMYQKGKEKANYGNYSGAIEEYDKYLQIDPANPAVYTSRGQAKEMNGDDRGALLDYDMAVAIDSTYAKAYNCRGLLFMKQKKYKEALVEFEKALELQPHYADVYINRGKTKVLLGDTINACNDFNIAETYGKKRANKLRQMYCK